MKDEEDWVWERRQRRETVEYAGREVAEQRPWGKLFEGISAVLPTCDAAIPVAGDECA